jgi:hypothetical protein
LIQMHFFENLLIGGKFHFNFMIKNFAIFHIWTTSDSRTDYFGEQDRNHLKD